jgi:hypothetical protein
MNADTARATGKENEAMAVTTGLPLDIFQGIDRIVRGVRVMLGMSDDVEVIARTIDEGLRQVAEVGHELARAELLKARAEIIQAEAAWMNAYANVRRLEIELAQAEERRDHALAVRLHEERLLLKHEMDERVIEAIQRILPMLRALLQDRISDYSSTVETPLLQLMPPRKAG